MFLFEIFRPVLFTALGVLFLCSHSVNKSLCNQWYIANDKSLQGITPYTFGGGRGGPFGIVSIELCRHSMPMVYKYEKSARKEQTYGTICFSRLEQCNSLALQ